MSDALVPQPPSTLSEDARARWVDVAPALAQRGRLDTETLAAYCQVWARWRQAEGGIAKAGQLVKNAKGRVVASPLVAMANQAAAQVRALEKRLHIGEQTDDEDESPSAPAGPLLTRRVLAAVLGVHMQTVFKWERDGLPLAVRGRKGKPSKYREADARAWIQAREDAAKKSGTVDVAQERARKERAQAVLAEQTYEARARELLPRVEVQKAWEAEVVAVRNKLFAWSATIADKLFRVATLEGLPGVENVLNEEIREVLRQLSGGEDDPPAAALPTVPPNRAIREGERPKRRGHAA